MIFYVDARLFCFDEERGKMCSRFSESVIGATFGPANSFRFFEDAVLLVNSSMLLVVNIPSERFEKGSDIFGSRRRFLVVGCENFVSVNLELSDQLADTLM